MTTSEELQEILDKATIDVRTDSYPMSLGELISMYERGEIVLRPEYQRYFRWTDEQKSKLIESILIGLPLPSFFMAQDENGNWEVLDGMQRLSTIFDFIGVLSETNRKQPNYRKFETLDDLFYLKEFSGKTWGDFTRRMQINFKRAKVQVTILMRETSLDAKFELFQRLNSGGTAISGQELRNAILARENPEFLSWLENLADYKQFKDTIGLSERDISTRYDMELVLRFIIFLSPKGKELSKFSSVDVFLTHMLREIIKDENFKRNEQEAVFKTTFDKIYETCGENALKYRETQGAGKFSISFFEAVALGIAQNIDNLPNDTILKDKIQAVAQTKDYINLTGSGKNAGTRIPKLLELGKSYFSKN